MSYVQQICEGYSKKSLMGNWYEQRIYPQQPFRAQQTKQARNKDQGITCFDNTGFQRALPRLSRRNKWQTTTRIILDDGINQQKTVMKQQYPNGEPQHANRVMTRPLDKNFPIVNSTTVHPHSQLKVNQKKYKLLDQKAVGQFINERNVHNYGSDFGSTLIQHPKDEKFKNYESNYKNSFSKNVEDIKINSVNQKIPAYETTYKGSYEGDKQTRLRATSQFQLTNKNAGSFNPTPQQSVKPITNMTGQLKKQTGDTKQITQIQRSWVPPRDKAISYSIGRTAIDFKRSNIPKNDIQTSINANVGVQNIHPKNVPDNFFRHVRQDVTIQPNNTFCIRP